MAKKKTKSTNYWDVVLKDEAFTDKLLEDCMQYLKNSANWGTDNEYEAYVEEGIDGWFAHYMPQEPVNPFGYLEVKPSELKIDDDDWLKFVKAYEEKNEEVFGEFAEKIFDDNEDYLRCEYAKEALDIWLEDAPKFTKLSDIDDVSHTLSGWFNSEEFAGGRPYRECAEKYKEFMLNAISKHKRKDFWQIAFKNEAIRERILDESGLTVDELKAWGDSLDKKQRRDAKWFADEVSGLIYIDFDDEYKEFREEIQKMLIEAV